jgi:hypothetical protein
MGLAQVGGKYWWTTLATDALQRAGASASPLPAGQTWTEKHSKAAKAFQRMARLTPDGDPGPNTVRELRAVVGPMPASDKVAAECLAQVVQAAGMTLLFLLVCAAKGEPWAAEHGPAFMEICNDFGNAWDDKCPAATKALFFHRMSEAQRAEWEAATKTPATDDVGALPLAAPLLLAGAEISAASAAAEVTVAALGAGVALSAAAWLAEKTKGWLTVAQPTAPESVKAKGTIRIAPPASMSRVGTPPPPRLDFDYKDVPVRKLLKGFVRWMVLTLAWLIGGIGTVATLFGPLVTAAAGAAGAMFWLALAAIAAFFAARRRKRG